MKIGKNCPIAIRDVNFDYVGTRLKSVDLDPYYGNDFTQLPRNISKATVWPVSALKILSRNKNIVILRPERGNRVGSCRF